MVPCAFVGTLCLTFCVCVYPSSLSICLSMCVYLSVCVCTCVCACVYMCVCVYVCMCVYVCICVCLFMYVCSLPVTPFVAFKAVLIMERVRGSSPITMCRIRPTLIIINQYLHLKTLPSLAPHAMGNPR